MPYMIIPEQSQKEGKRLTKIDQQGYSSIQQYSKLMENSMLNTSDLSQIYPDMGELFSSKHCLLLSQLKTTFADIYDELQPEQYAIVNGVAHVLDLGGQLQCHFAIQNGITVLVRKTYLNEDVYINGNQMEQELIFNCKGMHIEGTHPQLHAIQALISHIRSQSEQKQFYGAILYVYSNISPGLFSYDQCFMIGVLTALLITHQQIDKYSKADIMDLILSVSPSLSKKNIQRILFQLQLNQCLFQSHKMESQIQRTQSERKTQKKTTLELFSDQSITTSESNQSINSQVDTKGRDSRVRTSRGSKDSIQQQAVVSQTMCEQFQTKRLHLDDQEMKIVMCKLDLSRQQQQKYKGKMSQVRFSSQGQVTVQTQKDLSQSKKQAIQNYSQITININQVSQTQKQINHLEVQSKESLMFSQQTSAFGRFPSFKDSTSAEQTDLAEYYLAQTQLVKKLHSQQIGFREFISQKHQLDLKYQIYDQEVVDLIADIQQEAPFKHFCLIEGTVLMIAMDKAHYAGAMRFLRKLLNDYRLRLSTSQYLSTCHQLGEQRQKDISEIMFTSMPSLGCAIYSPKEELWI